LLAPILTTGPFNQTFDYTCEDYATTGALGQVVCAPFRHSTVMGVMWESSGKGDPAQKFTGQTKGVEWSTEFYLPPVSIQFIEWVSNYTLTPLGSVLKMVLALPPAEFRKMPKDKTNDQGSIDISENIYKKNLTEEQQKAADAIIGALNTFQPLVLDGVTGSGKTEVYLKAIAEVLKNNGQALVMLPEIVLTADWLSRFKEYFGFEPLLWHSDVTMKNKRLAWQKAIQGHPLVVVGARSALFLPFQNLKLIVVDEEHDESYKQQEQNYYHARDMAVARARLSKIPVVLASATPSLETMVNIKRGKYQHLTLSGRFGDAFLPSVQIVDMRNNNQEGGQVNNNTPAKPQSRWISKKLIQEIATCLANKEQALLFLNRKGYAPMTLCADCGHRFLCPGCSVFLVQHKHKKLLRCHHCNFTMAVPKVCPECHNNAGETAGKLGQGSIAGDDIGNLQIQSLITQTECQLNTEAKATSKSTSITKSNAESPIIACGPGVERIHEDIQKIFPDAKVLVVSSDSLSSPKVIGETIDRIKNLEVDIIIGTQVLAKGHHFPKLTLVGVIDADLGLHGSDLRACEKNYQLLYQVAGRAGREQRPQNNTLNTNRPLAKPAYNEEMQGTYVAQNRNVHGVHEDSSNGGTKQLPLEVGLCKGSNVNPGKVLLQTYHPEHPLFLSIQNHSRDDFYECELEQRKIYNFPPYGYLAAIIISGLDESKTEVFVKSLAKKAPRSKQVEILGPVPATLSRLNGRYRWRFLVKSETPMLLQAFLKEWQNTLKDAPKSFRISIDIDPYCFM